MNVFLNVGFMLLF